METKKRIARCDSYAIYEVTGITEFKPCQCFKNCLCKEDFIPKAYTYYKVIKLFGRQKVTIHQNMIDVQKRINQLKKLNEG